MITDKIKALFNFIDFLYSNIDSFNKYNSLITELELLKSERQKLKPNQNYKDKLKYSDLQSRLASKFKILQTNTINRIMAKAVELNLCTFEYEQNYYFSGVEDEIHQLKENFDSNDLNKIFKHKYLYLEFRKNTHKDFLSLDMFFTDLDRVNKKLFDYFKDTEQNEFETFEKKTIIVNSISRTIELFKKGYGDCKFEVNENYCLPDLINGIFDLTLQNLVDCGLSKENTLALLESKGDHNLQCNEGNFYVSKNENIFHTGVDFYRKVLFNTGNLRFPFNCPELAKEYYDLALAEYLETQKNNLGTIFNQTERTNKFIEIERDRTNTMITGRKEYFEKTKNSVIKTDKTILDVCESYLHFLNNEAEQLKQREQPQQLENNKAKKLKKTFFEFIHNIEDKQAFIQDLKNTFPTEIGKSIKAIIDILSNKQILIYGTKEFKQLFEEFTNCYDRDLGTYNSVQNVKIVDKETTDIINKKLNPLIIKHKTT